MPVTVTYKGKSLDAMMRDIQRAIQQEIPRSVKIMALEHYHNSFQNQGFVDASFQPWRQRKGEKRSVYFGYRVKHKRKDAKANRGLLVKSGRLRRSINGKIAGKTITISTDIPYAKIHNEGGRAGRNHSAKIPKRQFMGRSRILEAEIQKEIQKEINNALKK